MTDYQGKVAIVTGAASGMGKELVRQLAAGGATVIATDINGKGLDETIASFGGLPGSIRGEVLDVADAVRFRQLIENTARDQGGLDYVFNNAGIAIYGESLEMTRAQWEKIVNINLWGVINGTTAAYEVMAKQGHGHIVNTASAAGLAPVPMLAAYAMTKHAVVGLSTSMRAEAADHGVQINVVCPGVVSTGIFDATISLGFDVSALRKRLPVGEVSAEAAVQRILKGVERNEGVIIFPASAKFLDALIRVNRSLHEPLWQRAVREFRRKKQEQAKS